jgi:site-specific recombinase XerD
MTISHLADMMEVYLHNKKYAESTILTYRYTWNQLIRFSKLEGVNEYSFEYGLRFAKLHYGIDFSKVEPPFTNRQNHVYKALKSLDEYRQNLPISTYRKQEKKSLPEQYKAVTEAYIANYSKNVKPCSAEDAEYTLRKFTEYLCDCKVTRLDGITSTIICNFAATMKEYVATTRNSWLSRIRDFLKFAYENEYTVHNLSVFVSKARYTPPAKIPSVYTKGEIEKMLSMVDRANPVGKRDYAILKLAACLGIRSGDIAALKFENLDWDKNIICFGQEKTGNPQTLPLLNDVGESIIDYLKNGRPQSDLSFIFLKHWAPYTNLTSEALYPIMRKYRTLAKLPTEEPRKSGLHALRFSLASSMLADETPLPVISEILGHQNTKTTRIYTNIDIVGLRKCALEVPLPITIGGANQ